MLNWHLPTSTSTLTSPYKPLTTMKRCASHDSLESCFDATPPSSPLAQFSPVEKKPKIDQSPSVSSSPSKSPKSKKVTTSTKGKSESPSANGMWDGAKRGLFIDEIIAAGYKAVDLDAMALKLGLSKRQLIDQLTPNKSNLRGKAVKAAKGE